MDIERAPKEPPDGGGVEDMKTSTTNPRQYDNPFDFPAWKKWMITVLCAFLTVAVTFSSSIFSSTINTTSMEFGVSDTIMILGVSLYVLGFALGPIIWGPCSELLGRRYPLFIGYAVFALMQIPIALSKSLAGVLICRLLAGCFGSAPMVLVSAMYADYWTPAHRGTATAVYSMAVYIGPTLGPIVGAFVTESRLGWRWTAWLTLMLAALVGTPAFFLVPETYGPVLRERAAEKLRKSGVHVEPERDPPSIDTFVRIYLVKPMLMLMHEPVAIVITIYISIVYGILYLTFYAFPYSFSVERGWDPRMSSLPFISILLGSVTGSILVAFYSQHYYQKRLIARGRTLPEDRLPPLMLGSVILPAGLFWFGWTASAGISWVPQVFAGFFVGCGIMLIFTNGVAYVVDIYLSSSASAMTVNTCIRSFAAAGLPIVAPEMYKGLGTAWATSVLGFLCILAMPAPFLFYRYGAKLRQMSKFALTK
ncbi:uncharacterized protein Z518_03196 [Rhinocladiella mackenziei CBS 650.93]|uniref:Major facilitator superfamily (MFS) profile domain-containing protein n=1 Tax=Rhinocladiella mackenziei CBS 650.93 TaxID=1442369 RepID=A0A0D2JGV1_9EURO|nr:uncharacterized protein Z518_03196 [Rhinocladiella mackenziei CBS 650.93]KIX08540.1 hypothetical protein Z518_03196 [Rhinocladiella mackenziei CBS 650.93]